MSPLSPHRRTSRRLAAVLALWLGLISGLGEGLHAFAHSECVENATSSAAAPSCGCCHAACLASQSGSVPADKDQPGFSKRGEPGHLAHECEICHLLAQLAQVAMSAPLAWESSAITAEAAFERPRLTDFLLIGIAEARGPPANV